MAKALEPTGISTKSKSLKMGRQTSTSLTDGSKKISWQKPVEIILKISRKMINLEKVLIVILSFLKVTLIYSLID